MRTIPMTALALLLTFFVGVSGVSAQTTTSTTIEDLLKQVAALQAQIKSLEASNSSLQEEVNALRLTAKLQAGSSGENVRLLQQLLATDATIYPEGMVTGFFGPLTENAVKRFQAKLKLEQVGVVGPQTLARINEILAATGATIPANFLGSRIKIEIKTENGKEKVEIKVEDEDDDSDEDEDEDDDSDDDDEDDDSDDNTDEDEDNDSDDD